jgi:hypothetical protein
MNRQALIGLGFFVMIVCLVGCAPGPNAMKDSVPLGGSVAGFWLGLWHGLIVPFTFIVSLFSDNVTIYEIHNSGGWYRRRIAKPLRRLTYDRHACTTLSKTR